MNKLMNDIPDTQNRIIIRYGIIASAEQKFINRPRNRPQ